MDKQLKLLKDITDVNGIAGFETAVKEVMKEYLTPVSDELIYDNLGGIFGKKSAKNGNRTILIGGHMDEVGFMVTRIDDQGYIKFNPVGGWWGQVMLSQRMNVTTEKGLLHGVIGSKPPHILSPEDRKKPVDIKSMFLDIGVASKEEAIEAGVQIGDMITPHGEFTEMTNKDFLLAKAFDNRFGCAAAIEVLQKLDKEEVNVNVVSGATVQEEVGLRGAKVAAHKVKPDLAISVDVGLSYDSPGMSEADGTGKMGEGPLVFLMDASVIGHVGFRRHVQKVAKDKNIDIQLTALAGGGTDSGSFHVANDGVPSINIGVPTRYIHSNVSIMHRQDYNKVVELITEVVKTLDDDVVDAIIGR